MLLRVDFSASFDGGCCDRDDRDGDALAGDLVEWLLAVIGGFEFGFELPTVFTGDALLLLLLLLVACDMAEAFEGAIRFGEGFGDESGVDLGVDFGDLRLTRRLTPGEGLAVGGLAPR